MTHDITARRTRGSDEQPARPGPLGRPLRQEPPRRRQRLAGAVPPRRRRRRPARTAAGPSSSDRSPGAGRLGRPRRSRACAEPDRRPPAGPPTGRTRPAAGRPAAAAGLFGPPAARGSARRRRGGVQPTRATWSARRAGRCSTAGRSPTAAARPTPRSRELIASAPMLRLSKDHRPASVLRGRYGPLEMVAFDVVYASGRYVVPQYAVTAVPMLAAVPRFRLSPARFWKHRVGGLVPDPERERGVRPALVLLAAEDSPQLHRLVAGPDRAGPAARHRRRRRVLVGGRVMWRRSAPTATGPSCSSTTPGC